MTKEAYLENKSRILNVDKNVLSVYLDEALRALAEYAFIRKIVFGQIPEDKRIELPRDFYRVISLRTKAGYNIVYQVEEISNKKYLYFVEVQIVQYYERALISSYYVDVSNFVLEYSVLPTEITDELVLPIDCYIRYLLYSNYAEKALTINEFESIAENDGAISQTITFGSSNKARLYQEMANTALTEFKMLSQHPYMVRG